MLHVCNLQLLLCRKIMNWLRLRKATQTQSEENGVTARPQWDADYRLYAFPAMGMFEEYLEMGVSLCINFNVCMYILYVQ